ncbi:ribonuclease H-like protein [Aspergillus steynii IBT 23096]|uniref:ribonuclease H n=1 Tax=Aspergillus steynii IBT 23096 TaxID=1392250 RepID=A0A2I2G9Y6_9EURO|nr:ribonuclease H-like protein [Aspergillus steynii IBT 23096]PLB49699.1 ribonuclease H-like protein [Aspergillus steynii IBT 23096]
MVYQIHIYVDGGCRGNGKPGAVGAAAALFKKRFGRWSRASKRLLPRFPAPTNQRAEITAIKLGIEKAMDRIHELHGHPKVRVVIYSDSDYAIKCMTTWIYKWLRNDWTNARGVEVANRDLIEEASDLDDTLRTMAKVKYKWVPRNETKRADDLVNEALDEQ